MKISVRQICFILVFYTAASKLLQYPTLLSGYSGRDLLFSALISFAVEGIAVWAVAYLSSRTNKTFFGLVEDSLGKVAARIIYGLFALFFLAAVLLPLFEQKQFVNAVFYDVTPSFWVFVPIFLFLVYAGSKNFENVGRCADLCMPVFIITVLGLFAMALGETKFSNLLPVLKTPPSEIFGGALKTSYYFCEPAYLLMFLGHFKYKKGDAAKLTLSYAGGALIVLLFLALFFGIYAATASSRQFAVSKTSLYFSAIEMVGRVDLLALYVLEVVMLFALALNIQLAVHCIVMCAGWDCPEIISGGVNLLLAAVLYFFGHSYSDILRVFSDWLWIVVLIFSVAVPVAAWGLKRRKNER